MEQSTDFDCPNCKTVFHVSTDLCETCNGSGEHPECCGNGCTNCDEYGDCPECHGSALSRKGLRVCVKCECKWRVDIIRQHTQGELFYDPNTESLGYSGGWIARMGQKQQGDNPHGDQDADGERLAACWNACVGVSTEELKVGTCILHATYEKVIRLLDEIANPSGICDEYYPRDCASCNEPNCPWEEARKLVKEYEESNSGRDRT